KPSITIHEGEKDGIPLDLGQVQSSKIAEDDPGVAEVVSRLKGWPVGWLPTGADLDRLALKIEGKRSPLTFEAYFIKWGTDPITKLPTQRAQTDVSTGAC